MKNRKLLPGNRYRWGTFCLLVINLGVLTIVSTAITCDAGITFLPGQTRLEFKNARNIEFSLAVLAWELPGGLLVADRMTPAGSSRFGQAFRPYCRESDWYIVGTTMDGTDNSCISLTDYGWVHFSDGGYAVLEVSPDNVIKFAACPLKKQKIPRDPPPSGSEQYPVKLRRILHTTGLPGRTPTNQNLIRVFLENGDKTLFNKVVQEISGFIAFTYQNVPRTVHTRYYSTSSKTLVADYLGEQLANYGYDVHYEPFTVGSVSCRNVVATRVGSTYPDEYVILGGHYDSTSEQVTTLAPGADDNGSGTALVMEIARMAANYDFERSVQFVLFDSEEQGLNGSSHFVNQAVGSGRTIVAAIIADMVTYYNNHYGVIIEGETEWEALMSIMAYNTTNFTTLSSRKDYYSWGSDHVPFQQAGIPAFLAIEWDWSNYPYYHDSEDNWMHVMGTADIGFEISQACAATLAEVAGLRSPAVPTLSFTVLCLLVLILSWFMVSRRQPEQV